MGKYKLMISMVISCVLMGCKIYNNSTNIISSYVFINEKRDICFEITLLEKDSFEYRDVMGLRRRFSKGIYKLEGEWLILNSIYEGNSEIIPISWVVFEDERIRFTNKGLFYNDFFLKMKKYKDIYNRYR